MASSTGGTVASLWRHPVKSHGREEMGQVRLESGKCIHGDRRWAVAHEASVADGSEWAPCQNFSRAAKAPELMALTAKWDETANVVTMRHPELGEFAFDPDGDCDAFLSWSAPLIPDSRAASARVVRAPGRGMTDSDFPSISLNGLASHREISRMLDMPDLSIHRWRGNIWIDGLDPWEEAGWIGREIQIGEAVLAVREQITRCLATATDPATGKRAGDTLGALGELGHQEFGVYAEVVRGGDIVPGDRVKPL